MVNLNDIVTGLVNELEASPVQPFFDKLKDNYGGTNVEDEINNAIDEMNPATRDVVISIMESQADQFSKFVYDLTTSEELGDAIFGSPDKSDPQIQEYTAKLGNPEFTRQVMEDILADKEKSKEMGKETIARL